MRSLIGLIWYKRFVYALYSCLVVFHLYISIVNGMNLTGQIYISSILACESEEDTSV